ncbi:MAG: sugar phosphate isomerase/epimerase [Armatimonadetes bacterium]|nr:sugar phosphate isomerase/epimerase [Armatimonadota bacterium]
MEKHWTELMDLGIVHFMAYPVIKDDDPDLILQTAEVIARDEFFNVLEVRRSQHPGLHEKLRALADVSGLNLGVGGQPGLLLGKLSLNNPDAVGRQAAVDECKQAIDAAYELGARMMAVLSGPDPGEAGRAAEMDLLVDSCVQLCTYAQEKARDYTVWVSFEQFDDTVDKKCLIGPTERAVELAERVRGQVPNFGLCVDLSHLPLLGEDPMTCLSQASEYLIHVHAGNAIMSDKEHVGYGDMHPRFAHPAGENGVTELAEYLKALIYVGYFESDVPTRKPVFTFEVKPLPGESSELVIASTKRAFLDAWAALSG